MDEYSQKCLLDVKSACEEVESFFIGIKNFANFQTNYSLLNIFFMYFCIT